MNRLDTAPAETCVWMSAGVLSYKLCDRHFDCEHCPLDAALRGARPESIALGQAESGCRNCGSVRFPSDRRYSTGHTWLLALDGRNERFRLGLDAFAASLIGLPRQVRWNVARRVLARGEPICAIEFDGGSVRVGTPVAACLNAHNPALDDDPGILVAEPYADGWLVDVSRVDEADASRLLSADGARRQARLDLRMFRRRIALHLLADDGDIGPPLTDDVDLPGDPWHILGGAGYLEQVCELVH